jgi:glucose uptake protein GlcU
MNMNPYTELNLETGRKTFFWYRIYCGIMALLYLALTVFGIILTSVPFETREYSETELLTMGIVYAVMGAILFPAFAVATFLPAKPFNWVVGIVMMALGMTSCCLLPALIPLMIFWFKPETQRFFGRN